MTEDMRERFEKWTIDYHGSMPNSPFMARLDNNQYVQEVLQHQWEAWQAALSSAGTSGTADLPLEIDVHEGVLTVRIGVQTLKWAAEHSEEWNPFDDAKNDYVQKWEIANANDFAKDVRAAMLDEAEDGSHHFSRFLDSMIEEALNQGSVAVEECRSGVSAFVRDRRGDSLSGKGEATKEEA